jgi:type IX secretion system PorP/SprF family membrane protein
MKQFNIYSRTIITLSITLYTLVSYSQQDPQFTQYMYNMSVINPGYATNEVGMVNLGGLYRTQWVGLEGAPRTGTFFAHTPLSERVEAGISFTNDDIGDVVTENNIYADVAYVLKVSEKSKLSLGIKAGVTLFNANFSNFVLQQGTVSEDLAFNDNINKVFPNIGAGAFYFTDRFYAGLSAPNLLTSTHLENENGVKSTGVQDIHFFLTGGYVFDINEDIKLKPAFMMKGVKGAPFSMDLTANVLIYEKIEAGVGYRFDDSFSGLVNFRVTPQLRVGYAYDFTTSNLSNYSSGSHEILLLFDFDLFNLQRGYDRSPRFF